MDLYNKIASDAELKEHPHMKAAVDYVEQVLDEYDCKCVSLSFNGGKDCTVLFHLLRAALAHKRIPLSALDIVYFAQKNEFAEVTDFLRVINETYDLSYRVSEEGFKQGLQDSIDNHGTKAIFMGQRKIDPHSGNLALATPTDASWPQVMRINPILSWTYADVWDFLLRYELPYCSLYDQGYTSLGGTHNTQPNPALQLEDKSGYLPAYRLQDGSLERAGRS